MFFALYAAKGDNSEDKQSTKQNCRDVRHKAGEAAENGVPNCACLLLRCFDLPNVEKLSKMIGIIG